MIGPLVFGNSQVGNLAPVLGDLACTFRLRPALPRDLGGCQNYGPLLGPLNILPYYTKDPKRDHNFDNHPSVNPEFLQPNSKVLSLGAVGTRDGRVPADMITTTAALYSTNNYIAMRGTSHNRPISGLLLRNLI